MLLHWLNLTCCKSPLILVLQCSGWLLLKLVLLPVATWHLLTPSSHAATTAALSALVCRFGCFQQDKFLIHMLLQLLPSRQKLAAQGAGEEPCWLRLGVAQPGLLLHNPWVCYLPIRLLLQHWELSSSCLLQWHAWRFRSWSGPQLHSARGGAAPTTDQLGTKGS
jgi:hypothetical protein